MNHRLLRRLGGFLLSSLFLQVDGEFLAYDMGAEGITNLLRDDHLGVCGLGILQEDLLDDWLLAEVTQGLDAVHDPLVGVLIDWHCYKLRLANTDDRNHNQHGLSLERIDLLFVLGNLGTADNEFGNRGRKDRAGIEVSSQD